MQLPSSLFRVLESKDERIKFGTIYKEGTIKAEVGIKKEILEKSFELDTLYAFDNFIRNGDRGIYKTNLLIHTETEQLWLIDHELALDISKETISNFKRHLWEDKFSVHHFCYSYLKENNENVSEQYFNTFFEYLTKLNLNQLDIYFKQLNSYDYLTNKDSVLDYFYFVKQNAVQFISILKSFIK